MARRRKERQDAIDLRLWQIESAFRALSAGARPPDRDQVESLADALELGHLLTSRELREMSRREYSQPVVSVYLNLNAERVARRPPVFLSILNSLRRREETARRDFIGSLPTRQRRGLEADLDEVQELVGALRLDAARSVILFKSGKELNRAFTVPARATDRLTIDPDPYVEPLLALLEEHPPALVAEVHVEESLLWTYQLGYLEQVERVRAYIPTGDLDSRRPLKEEGHQQTHLTWHLKATAQTVSRVFSASGPEFLVLAGDQAVLSEFERYLPQAIGSVIEARLEVAPHRTRADWLRQVEEVVAGHRRRKEEELATHLSDLHGQGLLVSGLPAVVETVNLFLARSLAVSATVERPGFVCREHHFLSLDPGVCPFCESSLLPTENAVDELLEMARLHGVQVTVIEQRPELMDPFGGVAAVPYQPVAGPGPSGAPAERASAAQG